jgi:hypothetical protein
MKKTIPGKKRNIGFIFCLLLVATSVPGLASAYCIPGDTAVIRKLYGNNDQHIQLFSSSGNRVLYFSVKLKQKKTYRFFMFDMDGKLVVENDILGKEGVQFTNMPKGEYFFEILRKDERVENGTLTIK